MDVLDLPHDTFVKAYNKPLESHYYNQFFNPNICHVCKKRLASEFELCKCDMISYCGDDHKEMHYNDHRELCEAIFNVNGHEILWNTCCDNMSQWADTKRKLAGMVREELKRKLEPYEEQMFLFVRSCFICHARPERKDNFCKTCHCINYCNAHESALDVHKFFCSQLELSLSLELDNIESEIQHVDFLGKFPDSNRHLCDMFEFIKQYVLKPKQETWSTREFIFTDHVTDPLTVFYGITKMQLISRSSQNIKVFILHIIVGEPKDRFDMFVWEFLLHLLRFPSRLIIVVIGQKWEKNDYTFTYDDSPCVMCHKRSTRCQLEFYPIPYHDYVIKHPCYKKPNVIVGFDLKLNESWSDILKAIQAQDCPLLLTAKTLVQAQENINTISKCLGNGVKVFYNISNKFCGYIPHRDPDTENVYFLNKRLTSYWDLGSFTK